VRDVRGGNDMHWVGFFFCVMAGMGVQLTLQHQAHCTVQTCNFSHASDLTALYLGILVNAFNCTIPLKPLSLG